MLSASYDDRRTSPVDRPHPYRPRITRETRLLLTTALVAVVALWVLARARFPDRLPPANPVQPLLTQLTPRQTFADLASEIAALRPRLEPLLVAGPAGTSGLRVRDDIAAIWLDPTQDGRAADAQPVLARDPASGLTLLRVDSRPTQNPALWSPQGAGPRYFVASNMSPAGLTLRPVYVASLVPADNPRWPGPEWQLPSDPTLVPGSFLFTVDAAVAGLVVAYHDRLALIPAEAVLAEAERLLGRPATMYGYIGIEVQPLTAALSRATGADSGLIVTWVDPRGPAAGVLKEGDVIEAVNGATLRSLDYWDVQIARTGVGQTVIITARTAGRQREVMVVASDAAPADRASLGLTLRALPEIGIEIVRVEPGSAANRSGLLPGDVITRIDNTAAPTPAQLRGAFASVHERPLVVAFTRGTRRQVTALEK